MTHSTQEIIAALDSFVPIDDDRLELDTVFGELWSGGLVTDAIAALLRIFERFPAHDGRGVFWTIIHGLEAVDGYEYFLIESVQRKPSHCGMLMINRLIDAPQAEVDTASLVALLNEISQSDHFEQAIRDEATELVDLL